MHRVLELLPYWYPGVRIDDIKSFDTIFFSKQLELVVLRLRRRGIRATTIVLPLCSPDELDLDFLLRSVFEMCEVYRVEKLSGSLSNDLGLRIEHYVRSSRVKRLLVVYERDDLLSVLCGMFVYCLYNILRHRLSELKLRSMFPFRDSLIMFREGLIDTWYARGLSLTDGTKDRYFGSTDVLTLECVVLGFGLGRPYFARVDNQLTGPKPHLVLYVNDREASRLIWSWREATLRGSLQDLLPDKDESWARLMSGLLDGDGRVCLYEKCGRKFLLVRLSFNRETAKGKVIMSILGELSKRGLLELGAYNKGELSLSSSSRILRLLLSLGYPLRRDKRLVLERALSQ